MAKQKTAYLCQECGFDSPKWMGKCPGCGAWNTMVEEVITTSSSSSHNKLGLSLGLSDGNAPVPIHEVNLETYSRFKTGSEEFDRVLGGGVIPGSMVLIVGDPGVGKSSLTLKCSASIAKNIGTVLYVTGEESTSQVRLRANRIASLETNLFVLSETNLEVIAQHVSKLKPNLVVIDSIQTIFRPDIQSAPGSISQVRECAVQLLRLAKTQNVATWLVGHVLKDGSLAGPRALEHIVDTVLYFEGENNAQYRILRAMKNRFGSTNEIGLFEMRNEGLVDAPDASSVFLAERPVNVPGSVVIPTVEGTRPLLVEIQALVSSTPYVPPRRASDGIDVKRIQLILAVLEKRVGLHIGSSDVYVRVTGGISVDEPAVDLGLAIAIASSFRNTSVDPQAVVVGEVGLAGEVRAVSRLEQRIKEAEQMGFNRIICPASSIKGLDVKSKIKVVPISSVAEALQETLL